MIAKIKMMAFGMRGHSNIFRKVGGISQISTFIQPRVVAAPRMLTLRRCFAGFDVENRREHHHVTPSGSQNLQRSLQYTQLFHPGCGREVSTSCNPLKVEIKPEQNGDGLIYKGPLTSMVTLVKFFSLSTSMISTGLISSLVMSNEGGALTYIAGGFSSIMILTPIILHWFTKGYITQMSYNHLTNTYTASTFNFFLREKKTEFKRSDVSLPTVSQAISSFSILGKPVLVDPRGFINPNHYSALMGYTDSDGNVKWEKETNSEEVK